MDHCGFNISYLARQKAKKYIATNKSLLVFLALIFLISLITGIFVGIKGADNISMSNINDKTLIKFFKSDIGPFSFFIKRIIKYLFVLMFIFVCGKTKYCAVFLSLFIVALSYSIGLNTSVFILLLGFGGTINAILIIIPINICVIAVYIVACILAINNSQRIKKYGICLFDIKMLLNWIWFFAVLFVITILETILINVFSGAFIFNF